MGAELPRRFLGYAACRESDELRDRRLRDLPKHVVRVSNVTACGMERPPGLEQHHEWFTNLELLPTEEQLLAHLREVEDGSEASRPYSIFACFIHGIWFNESGAHDGFHECVSESLEGTPPGDDFKRVGYDAIEVEWYADVHAVGCAPLLCNGCHEDHPVNEECLLDTLEQALEAGKDFGATQPEPGDYIIIEIWRKLD